MSRPQEPKAKHRDLFVAESAWRPSAPHPALSPVGRGILEASGEAGARPGDAPRTAMTVGGSSSS